MGWETSCLGQGAPDWKKVWDSCVVNQLQPAPLKPLLIPRCLQLLAQHSGEPSGIY